MSEVLFEVAEEAIIDTLKLLPFLLLTYIAMETLEHCATQRLEAAVSRAGKLGPAIGALVGAIPQCGFSTMAATLFSGGIVSFGTLLAVMLATSDEMVPVFVAGRMTPAAILGILALKVAIAAIAGFTVDVAAQLMGAQPQRRTICDLCEQVRCGCAHEHHAHHCCEHIHGHEGELHAHNCTHTHNHEHEHECACTHEHYHHHEHHHEGSSLVPAILRSALVHTVQVGVFIFVVTLVLAGLVAAVGTDAIGELLGRHALASVLLAALVGLIPNCAVSVALSQLYIDGSLAAGALIAGLLSSAGVGLLVLFRTNRNLRQNLALVGILYSVGVLCGIAVSLSGVSF